ncbi:sigma factor [Nonomuraea longicatena]|uniref:RNA polymerase sigma-70 region 2 domain-containing protein n=1 Tax=Nonomuraea longicatena TaxID=83682 RepID=A0ABN1NN36_9ACTN
MEAPAGDRLSHQLVVGGDEPAFGELYDRYSPRIFALALRVTGDRMAAGDITQEVFLVLWERPLSYDPERGPLRLWLGALAHARALADVRDPGGSRDDRDACDVLSGGRPAVPDLSYLDAFMTEPAVPEGSLRPQLLAGARARRRPAAPTAGWAEPYAGRVAALDALLACAVEADWQRSVAAGPALREVVAGLASVDGLVAASVGAPVLGPALGATSSAGRTAEVWEYERRRSPEQTRRDWRAQADALCRHLAALNPAARVTVDGQERTLGDHMLARALDTWNRSVAAATAAGLRLPAPLPAHERAMAAFTGRV